MTDPLELLRSSLPDRYRLVREVGAGGMGRVYLAEDVKHHRTIAIKVLRTGLDAAQGAPRFLREIEIASGLSHPHIVPLYDSGVSGGFLYYVMPYVEGESLKDLLEKGGPMEPARALSIATDIADGLDFAHSRGFVHRDIKPGNILLAGRNALLADFGVARALEAAGSASLTETDVAVGTPHYMSPEQFSESHSADGRSDIYSMGCVLYEMLTGRPPFPARSTAAVIAGHLHREAPSLADAGMEAPPEVEALVARMLSKNPEDRFPSADELTRALASVHSGYSPAMQAMGERRMRILAGLATAAILAAVTIVSLPRGRATLAIDGEDESVVVLPYTSPGASPEETALALDVADEITLQLNRWETVRAVPQIALAGVAFDLGRRSSTFETVGEGLDVATEVGVRTVVTVSVRSRGDSAVVTSSLYDVQTGRSQGRPFESTGATADPYRLAAGVVHGILGLVGDVDEIEELRRQSAYPEALRRQTSGRDLLGAWRLAEAEEHFRDAIAIDSTFAMAHHYLSLSLYWQSSRERRDLESVGPEIGQRALAALRHAPGSARRDSLHIAAFHRFQEGDYEAARTIYGDLIRRDPTDVYGWLLLGAVEYHDPWLVERTDGTFTPRKSLNVALRAFREAVRLSPGFHLGYGHLFDVTRDVLDPIERGASRGFELPRDEPIRPWDFSTPHAQLAFSPVQRDTLEWVPADEYRRLAPDQVRSGAERLLRSSMRTLQRWSEFAPEEWRPHSELAAWTIRERALHRTASSPQILDSLAAKALRHARDAMELKTDTLAAELLTIANLELATGDLEGADRTSEQAEELLRRDAASVRPRMASNLALFRGQPRTALSAVDEEPASRRFFENPGAPGRLIDDGGMDPTLERLRVLGATGVMGQELTSTFEALMAVWSAARYAPDQLRILKSRTAPRVALALHLDPSRTTWFEIDPDAGDPIWRLIAAPPGRDSEAARERLVRAASYEDVQVGGSTRAFILGSGAQRAGMHREALRYLTRLDSIPHSVESRDPGWGLLSRSFLLRGRSFEALGERAAARDMYRRFLEAWSEPDDLGEGLAMEGDEALRRLAGAG